ncbi:MAG: hypothetical protein ACHQYP_04730, partial [Nitrospiria bacterium]
MKPNYYRFPLMAVGIISLFSALWGGLIRLGLNLPLLSPSLSQFHGPLMVSGFLGTLIGLERAVAINKPWSYGAPVLSGFGALTLILGFSKDLSAVFTLLSSLILVVVFLTFYLRQPELYTLTMGLGSISWMIGNFLWFFEVPINRLFIWWGAFLVLTIVGERLELARLGFLTSFAKKTYQAGIGLLSGGLAITLISFDIGLKLTGIGFIVLAVWLLKFDIARHTVRQLGLTRFIAIALLLGHIWLAVAGILSFFIGANLSFYSYDAVIHSLFIGFVFSMIFGHAPIIFPAILGTPLKYHPGFYLHLGLLHLTLILRVGSDMIEWQAGQKWAGSLNVIVILLFLFITVYSVVAN